ncbi:hypothetical protein FNF29_04498 [Cafeteria roenbergensis]|uniref:histidine kinase n=1 Tax=Cafeteria roenbergensis TaxID=33653 RepID=A0A5A8CG84_CAFRO|nr:hypothetical protein FNF29_04498 [Cafeteria roenbergensis]|eukprot:KAA0151574.1 hypothetical protein FNF29_04498 [Cafeteria roenbergensis]
MLAIGILSPGTIPSAVPFRFDAGSVCRNASSSAGQAEGPPNPFAHNEMGRVLIGHAFVIFGMAGFLLATLLLPRPERAEDSGLSAEHWDSYLWAYRWAILLPIGCICIAGTPMALGGDLLFVDPEDGCPAGFGIGSTLTLSHLATFYTSAITMLLAGRQDGNIGLLWAITSGLSSTSGVLANIITVVGPGLGQPVTFFAQVADFGPTAAMTVWLPSSPVLATTFVAALRLSLLAWGLDKGRVRPGTHALGVSAIICAGVIPITLLMTAASLQRAIVAQTQAATHAKSVGLNRLIGYVSHEARNPISAAMLGAENADLDLALAVRRLDAALAHMASVQGHDGREEIDSVALAQTEAVAVEWRSLDDVMKPLRLMYGGEKPRQGGASHVSVRFAWDAGTLVQPGGGVADARPEVALSATSVGQVLTNFCSNAVKFATSRVDVEVTIATQFHEPLSAPAVLVLVVRDDGAGVPPEHRSSLFASFQQLASSSLSQRMAGTGLGLAFCRAVASLMGGAVGHRDRLDGQQVQSDKEHFGPMRNRQRELW